MKKIILLLVSVLAISACSQSKNVYFNGAEGSHSGIRYSSTDKSISINP
ncbi:membrane lipoprotein lipid attachment site-containing protein [Haemophilus sputorum]|nr:membrane lipoprotein lipid attachment site-containing protein [Haemophilus sputorum]